MPRTHLSRRSDTRRDLISEMRSRIKEMYGGYEPLARLLHITPQALSYRVNHLAMNYDQMVEMFQRLDFPPDKILRYMSGGDYK